MSNAKRMVFSASVLVAFAAIASGCYVEPSEPSASAPESADDALPPAIEIAVPPPTSASITVESAHVCWIHWTRSMDGEREETISHYGCGPDVGAHQQPTGDIDVSAAHAICSEGSVAECELACSGGRFEACVELAQILRAGARVPADPNRADGIVLRACNRGNLDACLQRGVWLRDGDAADAADFFARACDSASAGLTTTTACAEWMNLLDAHAYEPRASDEVAGLSHVCTLEQTGKLAPDSTWTDGTLTVRYAGGACGRLKDLGMAPTQKHWANAGATSFVNPAAPNW